VRTKVTKNRPRLRAYPFKTSHLRAAKTGVLPDRRLMGRPDPLTPKWDALNGRYETGGGVEQHSGLGAAFEGVEARA